MITMQRAGHEQHPRRPHQYVSSSCLFVLLIFIIHT